MKNLVQNSRGQFLIETVLMMVLTLGLFMTATKTLREKQVMAKLIGGPWGKISGMIESGVWEKPEQARTKHPNQISRSLSYKPEP